MLIQCMCQAIIDQQCLTYQHKCLNAYCMSMFCCNKHRKSAKYILQWGETSQIGKNLNSCMTVPVSSTHQNLTIIILQNYISTLLHENMYSLCMPMGRGSCFKFMQCKGTAVICGHVNGTQQCKGLNGCWLATVTQYAFVSTGEYRILGRQHQDLQAYLSPVRVSAGCSHKNSTLSLLSTISEYAHF
jgi:hypothetical protein